MMYSTTFRQHSPASRALDATALVIARAFVRLQDLFSFVSVERELGLGGEDHRMHRRRIYHRFSVGLQERQPGGQNRLVTT